MIIRKESKGYLKNVFKLNLLESKKSSKSKKNSDEENVVNLDEQGNSIDSKEMKRNREIINIANQLYWSSIKKMVNNENLLDDSSSVNGDINLSKENKKLILAIDMANAIYEEIITKIDKDNNNSKTKLFSPKISDVINSENKKMNFSNCDLKDKLISLLTIITKLCKANTSNQGKLFGISYVDYARSSNIQYSFSIIRESVTGFYTKKIDINNV
ncbi:MAG: hypothetical protein VB122_02745 [Erysipelotrichales bacterium]|nr:hypothetical protein [Erysipelotrichales bacterium]